MGFNLSGIGNLITNAGGGQFVDVFNQVLDPVMGIANPFLDLGGSFLKSVLQSSKGYKLQIVEHTQEQSVNLATHYLHPE